MSCSRIYLHSKSEIFITPKEFNYDYKSLFIPIKPGIKLPAWHLYKGNNSKKLVVQFHGNSENRSSQFFQLSWVVNQGFDFITFDYRGFGELINYEENLIEDGVAVLNWLGTLNYDEIILVGQSLGGMVLTNALSLSKINYTKFHIVLDCSFSEFRSILKFKSKEKFNLEELKSVSIIHGELDKVISYKYSNDLYQKIINKNKELIILKEAKHLESFLTDNHKMRNWFTQKFGGTYASTISKYENCNLNLCCDEYAKKYKDLGSKKLSQMFYRAKIKDYDKINKQCFDF